MKPPLDMRQSWYWHCSDCDHDWVAPAASRCPRCHSDLIEKKEPREFEYPRA